MGKLAIISATTVSSGAVLNIISSESFTISLGDFTFTRASDAYVKDYDDVYIQTESGEEGYQGGRRVKNIYLNSASPNDTFTDANKWIVFDNNDRMDIGSVTYNGQVVDGGIQALHATQHPIFYISGGSEPGDRKPTIWATRIETQEVGTAAHYGVRLATWGTWIGSESTTFEVAEITDNDWHIVSTSAIQFERHLSPTLQPRGVTGASGTINMVNPQIEDVSGEKDGKELSGEYVVSTSTPGIQWYLTEKSVTRSDVPPNETYDAIAGNNGGLLTVSTGSAITPDGLISEIDSTNLCTNYNTFTNVGTAVLDGANTNFAGVVPATNGRNAIYIDSRSSRFVHSIENDIAFVDGGAGEDTITSSSTDFEAKGFRVSMTIWTYNTTNGIEGPFVIQSIAANQINLPTASIIARTADAAVSVSIHRCPADGDDIIVVLNDGTALHTTVNGDVTLPATYADHAALSVTLTDQPASDGGVAGSNNNAPVWYWDNANDLDITLNANASATLEYVKDDLVAAGLGYLSRTGLALKFIASGGTGFFDFPGATPTKTAHSTSAWTKTDGTNSTILVSGQPGTTFNNTSWERVTDTRDTLPFVGLNMRISVPNGETIWVLLNQFENLPMMTSPIITEGATASRNATVTSKNWDDDNVNDIYMKMEFTPSQADIADKQVLWSIYESANDYVELDLTNTTLTLTKVVSGDGTPPTATQAFTPVAGTTFTIESIFSTEGMRVSVDGSPGTLETSAEAKADTNITTTSSHEIGSTDGSDQASGAFSTFSVSKKKLI